MPRWSPWRLWPERLEGGAGALSYRGHLMRTADLDYVLPEAAIAQHPLEPRDSARLLVASAAGEVCHRTVSELPDLLDPGDLLVVNDSRVIPARLLLRKSTGGAVEVLLLARRSDAGTWEALVRPSRRVPPGAVLELASGSDVLRVTVGETLGDDGRREVQLHGDLPDDLDLLAEAGEIPLPPYIHEPLAEPERYQTVFAAAPGSVAAPTAGLHLTDDVLRRCRERGIAVATIELEVGLGTFRPITTERVEDHPLHSERYRIPAATLDALAGHMGPRDRAGRVVAVGTTVVRALESWAADGSTSARSDLFIRRGHSFRVVDRLITNFHVPRSSLLALVEAFVGPGWRDLYESALRERYRFLSFGDAMLLDRRAVARIDGSGGDEP